MRLRHLAPHARWLVPLAVRSLAGLFDRRTYPEGEVHVILAIADHFEPHSGDVSDTIAQARVDHWVETYPAILGGFRDSDGRPPRHTFFYPVEVYQPGHLDALAALCRAGFGEVEVHLHHDGDTPESLRRILLEAVDRLAGVHGLLGRHRDTGAPGYAFVHGNWALDNARPDGRWCGVNDEISVLRETGCYADFTFPSAPSVTQPPTFNALYYATSSPHRPRGHDRGLAVGGKPASRDALMLLQGPLALDWSRRKWGILPRLENACIQVTQPATVRRLGRWLKARVQVAARPDWYFVKLHAHGAPDRDRDVLIGPAAVAFHDELARLGAERPGIVLHYVTAREMYNLARAAELGWTGTVASARDFEYLWESSAHAAAVTPAAPATAPPGGVADGSATCHEA